MEFQSHRTDAHVSFMSISLIMTLLLGVAVPSGACADEPSFSTVVESRFHSWVSNDSDCLTPSRINRLVLDPQVKGDEAAAVAAIHVYFRGHKGMSCLKKADLLNADRNEGPPATPYLPLPYRGLNYRFGKFSQHIKMVPRVAFADNAPRLAGISQGPLGDCWVVSCIGAMAHFHPDRLKEIIVPQADGSYTVKFNNGSVVRVNALTDGQIALSSTADQQGLWLKVLEQAFGQIRHASTPRDRDEVGLDSINRGGDPCRVITLLTGHAARHVHIRPMGAKAFPPDLERRPQLLAQVRNLIREAVTQQCLMCAGTTARGTFPPGIRRSHDYAVLGYQEQTDTVTLWNPHGGNYVPMYPGGINQGYVMIDGILRMPLHDFTLIFGGLFVETS
jgi:hypothetical protein